MTKRQKYKKTKRQKDNISENLKAWDILILVWYLMKSATMSYFDFGVISHEIWNHWIFYFCVISLKICNHEIFWFCLWYLMKSATMRHFDSGVISNEICNHELFCSGVISHEIGNHELFWFWHYISWNLKPWDIVILG